jgi:ribosomal-protein-alanine N-acetyltransferase
VAVIVDDRPRGARVAVEGHAHAARVDELDLAGRAGEGQVGVAEDQPPHAGRDAAEQLVLAVGGLGQEGPHVARGGGVHEQRLAVGHVEGQLDQLGDRAGAERLAAVGRRGARELGAVAVVREPALGVAAQPRGVGELAQAGDRLGRPGAEQRDVAADDPAADTRAARVVEDRLQGGQVAVDVVEQPEQGRIASRVVTDFAVSGPTLALRLPALADAPALFALASDPEVTRFFSWGPYEREAEAVAYLERLPAQREAGEHLDLLVEHREAGPIGITGLSEISRRDRRGMVGTWFGRAWWGTGANAESKALVAHLAFHVLGFDRVGAYTNVEHTRSQGALARLGFQREGVLRRWHRHGDRVHDVVVWSLLREEFARSPLARVDVAVRGRPPAPFVLS